MKLLKVDGGHVPQFPIAGDATALVGCTFFSPERWQAFLNTLAVEMWYRAHKNDV